LSAIQYTADDLIVGIRDQTFVSSDARDWPADKLTRLLNRCLETYLVPFIIAADEEFYIAFSDIPVVSGQVGYALPQGCHAGNLRLIQLLDNQGQPSRVLPQKELDIALNPFTVFGVTAGLGTPSGFYLEGNQFFPQPIASSPGVQSFRVHYPLRPSQLVRAFDDLGLYNEAWEIVLGTKPSASTGAFNINNYTGAAAGGTATTFGSISPFVGAGGVTYTCDVIQATAPYDILGTVNLQNNQTAGSVNFLTSLTLNNPAVAADPRWVVGQPFWLALTGTSPVVTATNPELSFGLMLQWAIAKVLESKADDSGYGMALKGLEVQEERAKEMLRRRVRGPGKRAFANPYSGKGGRGIVAFYT
jgi:hypothetical protein